MQMTTSRSPHKNMFFADEPLPIKEFPGANQFTDISYMQAKYISLDKNIRNFLDEKTATVNDIYIVIKSINNDVHPTQIESSSYYELAKNVFLNKKFDDELLLLSQLWPYNTIRHISDPKMNGSILIYIEHSDTPCINFSGLGEILVKYAGAPQTQIDNHNFLSVNVEHRGAILAITSCSIHDTRNITNYIMNYQNSLRKKVRVVPLFQPEQIHFDNALQWTDMSDRFLENIYLSYFSNVKSIYMPIFFPWKFIKYNPLVIGTGDIKDLNVYINKKYDGQYVYFGVNAKDTRRNVRYFSDLSLAPYEYININGTTLPTLPELFPLACLFDPYSTVDIVTNPDLLSLANINEGVYFDGTTKYPIVRIGNTQVPSDIIAAIASCIFK